MEYGFTKSSAGHSLFAKGTSDSLVVFLLYVYYIVLAILDPKLVQETQNMVQSQFKLKLLCDLKYFLGLEITHSNKWIHLCQKKYTLQLLMNICFIYAKPLSLPMEHGATFNDEEWPLLEDVSQYRRVIDRLLYLTIYRPGISYDVHKLRQYMSKPRKTRLNGINHIL